MNFKTDTKRYKCKIDVLSPIHIGSGNSYTQSELLPMKNKGKISPCRINIENFFKSLSDENQDKFIEEVIKFETKSQKHGGKKFGDKKEFQNSLKEFNKENKTKLLTKKNFNKFKRYCLKTDIDYDDDFDEKLKKIPTRIEEHIKTFDKCFIPGSSIKGSMKIAILHKVITENILNRNTTYDNYEKSIKDIAKFIDEFFSSEDLKNSKKGKSYYNISRFLHISDSNTIETPHLFNVTSLGIAKDKYPKSKTYNQKFLKEGVNVDLETISMDNDLSFEISTNYDSDVYNNLNLESKEKLISIDTIKSAIYEFSKDLVKYERSLLYHDNAELNKLKTIDVLKLSNFYDELEEKINEGNILLKLGHGSGFLATTLAIRIKEVNKNLFKEIVKKIANEYDEDFPKSRSIVQGLNQPLGWVKLSFKEI